MICLIMLPAMAGAQVPATRTATAPSTTASVRNRTRVETWRFFEPTPGDGNPDDSFIANWLQGGVRHVRRRWDVTAALQYVQP